MMKKICLILFVCILMVGCGKYTVKDAQSDLEKKINKADSYNLTGEMEIINNDDVYKYDVDVSYSKNDKFRVSLKNKTNNHEQIILKNSDGVYVLTPTLHIITHRFIYFKHCFRIFKMTVRRNLKRLVKIIFLRQG